MPGIPRWRRYLRFWRPDAEADVDDELRTHFELRIEELRARDASEAEARQQAMEEFGDLDAARRLLQGLAPGMPYVDVRSFEELVAPQLQPWRLGATMFAVFGGLALVIAAVGLYGVLAYAVSQRTHEVGIRLALGATTRDVVGLVVRDGVRVTGVGIALGAVVALAAGRFVAPLLYETSPRDPVVLGAAAITLLVVAVLASLIPARRAAHVDPSVALRGEP